MPNRNRRHTRMLERKRSLSKLIPNRGSVRDHFHDYCSSTSIHGIKYFGEKDRPLAERLCWVAIFVICLAGNGYLIHKVWRKWNDSPVIVSFAETTTPVWQVPFPAVTICSEVKSRASVFNFSRYLEEYNENGTDSDIQKKLGDISLLCDQHVQIEGEGYADDLTIEFLKEVAPPLNEAMWICKWKEYIAENCTGLFTEIITEEGLCYTFNMLDKKYLLRGDPFPNYKSGGIPSDDWTLGTGYSPNAPLEDAYPYRALAAGAKAGLGVVLRAKKIDHDFYCRGPVQGFKVLFHNPAEFPNVGERYLRVPINQEVIAVIQPQIMTTSDGLVNYSPERRQCYFPSERYLKFFKVYTQRNCELECIANYTEHLCSCVSLHMPRDKDTPICGPGKKECVIQAGKELLIKEINYSYTSQTSGACHCLQACTSITYNTESSQAYFDTYSVLSAYHENLTEYQGLDASRISVLFKDMQFTTSRRSELFGPVDFLANCGGLLGLCCGVSVLSLVELVYYITLRFWGNLKKNRKKQSNINEETKSTDQAKLESISNKV